MSERFFNVSNYINFQFIIKKYSCLRWYCNNKLLNVKEPGLDFEMFKEFLLRVAVKGTYIFNKVDAKQTIEKVNDEFTGE